MNTQQHNYRLAILFFVFIAFYGFLLVNLYSVQIRQYPFFKKLAQQQYSTTLTTTPERAEIFDRFGQPLALNKESLSAFIVPSKLEEPALLDSFLSKHFKTAAERLKKNKSGHFMYIKRRLSDKEVELIKASGLTDIKLLKEPSRFYPMKSVGPLIGITDIDNQGLFGIELMFNNQLAGKKSTFSLEKDCRSGIYFSKETKIEGTQGSSVTLTLDAILQFLVYEELKEYMKQIGSKEGSVIILNPDNGDILAMANYPDFDQSDPETIDQANTKNRIVTDTHELGSVIKAFLALAAFEEKVVKPHDLIDCEGKKTTRVNGWIVNTTKANGVIPFEDVIKDSNNIGVAKVAFRVGSKLYDHYRNLGFSKRIGMFAGENWGMITPPERWSKGSLISLSFGYEISANMLQLAQAMSIVANDGYLIPPHLIKTDAPIQKQGPFFRQEAINQLKMVLRKTIDEGAATKARISGYSIMGKTGTARALTNGRYDNTRHLFTFMAIVEKGSYRRIVTIFLKETAKKGLLASAIAAPLFEKVAHKMLIHEKIL
jgi:cell division protein FtsI (penicillin-binding protein 3)